MTYKKQLIFCIMSLFFNVVLAMEINEKDTTHQLAQQSEKYFERISYIRACGFLLQESCGKLIAKKTGNDKFSDFEYSKNAPGTYQLEAFRSCLNVKSRNYLRRILIINPYLFAFDQSDFLKDIIEDLIKKQSDTHFQSIQLLLSLSLYPKEYANKWPELKQIGIHLSDKYQNSDARKLFEDLNQ